MLDDRIKTHCRQAIAALVVFGVVLNTLMLTVPLYMLQIYDRVLASGSVSTLLALSAIAAFCLIFMAGLEMCRVEFVNRTAMGVETVIGPKVVHSALLLKLQNPGLDANATVRDLEKIRSVFISGSLNHLIDLPWFPLYLVVIYLFHPILGFLAIGGAVVLLVLAVTNEIVSRSSMHLANQKQEELAGLSDGMFRCSDAVWAMGHEPALLERWSRLQISSARELIKALQRGGNIQALSRSFRQGLQVGLLGFGAALAIDGDISPGVMVVASIVMGRALAPIEQTIGNWRTLKAGGAAWKRLRNLVKATPPSSDSALITVNDASLEIRNCSFVPPGSRMPVLRGINVDIASGEVIALIGPSGSGKTSLVKLLAGILMPTTGTVNIGGHAVSKLAPEQSSALIGYIPQDFEFIPGSIAANISGFTTEIVNDRVVAAAKTVGLHDLIQSLPDGYRTHLSSTGNSFSRGQLQRLALARSLYNDPAIVVMDEPSSSLDQIGEDHVLDAIEVLKKSGKTVVIVAHRPSILTHTDRVIVLKNGTIETIGKYSEILPYITGRSAARPAPEKTASLVEKVRI